MPSWVYRFKMENDLLLINVLGVLLVLAIVLVPESFVRAVIGVPFLLFFPGYALICVLFPRKKDLDEIERVALSVGLSIAVVPLIGLVLNYTPFGIRLYPVLVSMFFFTFGLSLATAFRRKAVPVGERFNPSFSVNLPRWGNLSRVDKVLSVALIGGVVVSGSFIANLAANPRVGERFTEFYVLGPNGKIEGYPTNLTLGESGMVILGVVNHEYEEVNYRVAIKLDNETLGTIEGIRLGHEDKWEQNVTFAPNKVGDKLKLEFLLYANGGIEPYRKLHIWIIVHL